MEFQIVSNTERINTSAYQVYFSLSKLSNFDSIPKGKGVNNWETTEDTLSFNFKNFIFICFRIIEREEYKLIKIASEGKNPFSYKIWIQLKEINYNDTRMRITMRAEMGIIKKILLKRFLKKMISDFASQIAQSFNVRVS